MLKILLVLLALTASVNAGSNVGAIPIQHKIVPPPAKPVTVIVEQNGDDGGWPLIVAVCSAIGGLGAIAGAWAKWGRKH
jgi:hypothetical protein